MRSGLQDIKHLSTIIVLKQRNQPIKTLEHCKQVTTRPSTTKQHPYPIVSYNKTELTIIKQLKRDSNISYYFYITVSLDVPNVGIST